MNGTDYQEFPSVAMVEMTTIPSGINFIRTLSYDGSTEASGATWARVSARPPHSAWIQSFDGAIWEINEPSIDPRMLGAKADVVNFTNCTMAAGSSQVTINDQIDGSQAYVFTSNDIGKVFTIWQYPYITGFGATYVVGTIQSFTNNITNATVTLSNTNTGADLTSMGYNAYFGTNDGAAINAALSASGYSCDYFDNLGSRQAGGAEVVFRNTASTALDGTAFASASRSIYGIASPIYLLNQSKVRWQHNAVLAALGTWNGTAMIMQQEELVGTFPRNTITGELAGINLDGCGFAGGGVFIQKSVSFRLSGNKNIFNCQSYGVRLGDSANGYTCSGWRNEGILHCESVTTTHAYGAPTDWVNTFSGTVTNPTSGIGFWVDNGADSHSTGAIECVNYRIGHFHNAGTDCDYSGRIHCWTIELSGYMAAAAVIITTDAHYFSITADTPWNAPNQPYYGVINAGSRIDYIRAELNLSTTKDTQDQMGTAYYLYPGSAIGASGSQGAKPRVGSISYSSTDPTAARWAQIVDNSAYITTDVLPDAIFDGNAANTDAHDLGLDQQNNVLTRRAAVGTLSMGADLGGTLWSPIQLSSQLKWWLDANLAGSLELDVNSDVRFWHSRNGAGSCSQSFFGTKVTPTARPAFNPTGLTGGGYAFNLTGAVDFNGSAAFLMADDIIREQTDIRIFDVLVPQEQTGSGLLLYFNNFAASPTDPATGVVPYLSLSNNDSVISYIVNAQSGGTDSSVTVSAGTPYLVTAIYSSIGIDGTGTGSAIRLNGGTNAALGTLGTISDTNGPKH